MEEVFGEVSMSANDRQVGGQHYKTRYEHWDLAHDVGMGYFDGCATKYITRWRDKDGIESLRKSVHYTEKLIEIAPAVIERGIWRPSVTVMVSCLHAYSIANNLNKEETAHVTRLATWSKVGDLQVAVQWLRGYVTKQEMKEPQLPPAKPVPATEENKHAERAAPTEQEGQGD